MKELLEVELPDGQMIWANVEINGPRQVGASKFAVTGLTETLRGVATNVRSGLAAIKPTETTVEFGVDIALGKEGIVAALAGVQADASLKVTLTWSEDPDKR